MKANSHTISAVIAALGLTACSIGGEPSESDIEKAFRAQTAKDAATIAATIPVVPGEPLFKPPQIHSLKKLGCAAAKDTPGYRCDVEIDMTVSAPFIGTRRSKNVVPMRLVKGSDGWVLAGVGRS